MCDVQFFSVQELQTNTHHKHPEGAYFDKTFAQPVDVHKGDMFGEFNLGSTLVLIFEAPKGFDFKIQEGKKLVYGSAVGTSP
jgi:phosphatidylserine decarboxylase